ncbi:ribonuclease H protein, partial [Trifolium medium]|nr:ribonuclease H protein [Trifolium medium]
MKADLHHILPMQMVNHFSKYLGMPTQMGRSKRQVFDYIQDRIWKKLTGWKEKHLSFAGRSTLIKAVAQAIPTYIMSCFLLPKNFCYHIERIT